MLFENRNTGLGTEVRFRPFARGDGASFCQCIDDFYDGGYPYKEYLDEEFLLAKIAAGDMTVLCGTTLDGEIISTSALCMSPEFKGSALLMLRVVKKAYRGMGIGTAQEDYLFRFAKEHTTLLSLYADVMTHNSISQRGLVNRGFVYCGIRMMLYRNPVMIPRLNLAKDGKVSQVIMCKSVCARSVGKIYCPVIHKEKVLRIYNELGVDCQIDTGENQPKYQETRTSWHMDEVHHCAILTVHTVGKNFSKILSVNLEQVSQWENATVLCYLNLCDPAAISAYSVLKNKGFFFTGIKPLQALEEYMLLAYIGTQTIRYEDIHLHDLGKPLMSYIQNQQGIKEEEKLENNKK